MAYALKLRVPINFDDFTLIIPSISVGNVPQLTINAIIASYKFKNAGMIYHPALIPIAGWNIDYSNDNIEVTTACDLYIHETAKTAVVQILSGTEPCRTNQFIHDLSRIITSHKFKETIILTTTFSYEMRDVTTNLFRYAGNFNPFKEHVSKLDENTVLNGAGYANLLLNALTQVARCILVVQNVSEGDNTADALQMVDFLRRNLDSMNKLSDKVRIPVSWQYLYGKSAPAIIY